MIFLQVLDDFVQSTDKEVSKISHWLEKIEEESISYAPKILFALALLVGGTWFIRKVSKLERVFFQKRNYDPNVQTFLISLTRIGLNLLLFLTVISILGVNITSFAALLAGAGLALGSALNGSLGNFAGGVMILILRPFRIGDLIEAQNNFGIVTEIGIVYTTIVTAQNKTIRLPNGSLSTGIITNFTDQENLRIDLKVPLASGTDIDKARQLAVEAMSSHPKVISDPAPDAKVAEVTGDGIILVLWPRIKIKNYDVANPRQMEADYYSVYYGVQEMVKKKFQENGIETPSSTLEVKMTP